MMARLVTNRDVETGNTTVIYGGGGSSFLLWVIAVILLILAYTTAMDETTRLLLKVRHFQSSQPLTRPLALRDSFTSDSWFHPAGPFLHLPRLHVLPLLCLSAFCLLCRRRRVSVSSILDFQT